MIDRREMREATLRKYEAMLANDPALPGLQYERALLLDALGRPEDAVRAYEGELARDPLHFGALNNLAGLHLRAGRARDARVAFAALADRHPKNAVAHANHGYMLLKNGEHDAARTAYERAVALDPKNAESRKGLGLVLAALGDADAARRQAEAGFREAPVSSVPYAGNGTAPTVLAIVSYTPGNVHLQHYVTPDRFGMHKIVCEYFDATQPLPAHDVVFNAVGDADICAPALAFVASLASRTTKPLINAPDAVARSARGANAERFRAIANVRTPRIRDFARAELAGPDGDTALANAGFAFPLLLRAPGFHAGQHFERVEREADLAQAVARIPGDRILVLEFLDVRGADGMVRKYRAMFVDGAVMPLHLAISSDWKVHYFSADMAASDANRAEDAAFLADLPAALGANAVTALEAIRDVLALDYGGIDFALDRDGNVVVFEANATMVVPVPKPDPRFAYRRATVDAVHAAVHAMIARRAAAV